MRNPNIFLHDKRRDRTTTKKKKQMQRELTMECKQRYEFYATGRSQMNKSKNNRNQNQKQDLVHKKNHKNQNQQPKSFKENDGELGLKSYEEEVEGIQDKNREEDEDDGELPRKRFEPDFPQNYYYPEPPTADDYERYERLLFQSEFRKLLQGEGIESTDGWKYKTLGGPRKNLEKREEEEDCWSTIENSSSSEMGLPDMMDAEEEDGDSEMEEMRMDRRCENCGPHPLLMPEIIEQVLGFLSPEGDKETLESCLGVSRTWATLAQDKLLHSCADVTPFDLSTQLTQMRIKPHDINRLIPPYCHHFKLDFLPPRNSPGSIETIFRDIGEQMRELDVCINSTGKKPGKKSSAQPRKWVAQLGDYLEKYCPHLEKLKFALSSPQDQNSLPASIFSPDDDANTRVFHFLPVKTLETSDFSDRSIFPGIISSSPLLESLTFEHESTELIIQVLKLLAATPNLRISEPNSKSESAQLLRAGAGLAHLKSLEISHSDVTQDFINFALKHRWSLEHLKIGFSSKVPVAQIRAFLTHMRCTLNSLVLLYKGKEYYSSLPISTNWAIPLCLGELKSLEISPNVYSNATRFLVNALQLPGLKTLRFDSCVSWEEDFFDGMWNNRDFEGMEDKQDGGQGQDQIERSKVILKMEGERKRCPWKWKEPTIESLDLSCGCADPSIFTQVPNPWRNLKDLKVNSPGVKVIQIVFGELRVLERLDILDLYGTSHVTWDRIYKDGGGIQGGTKWELEGRPVIWDEIFTGRKKPDYTLQYGMNAGQLRVGGKEEFMPAISNLTNLKFLHLDFNSSLPAYEKLSDFFIYHGLSHLRALQHVAIPHNTFSDDAIEELRSKLCGFCHLDFGGSEEEEEQQ